MPRMHAVYLQVGPGALPHMESSASSFIPVTHSEFNRPAERLEDTFAA